MKVEARFNGTSRQLVITPSDKIDEQYLKLFAQAAKTAKIASFGANQEGLLLEAIDEEKEGQHAQSSN
jgi:hypothetical protein